ncbi:MAG TPA: TolC family protein [Pyrinomonadaceae bacterium]|nr:TolC family protein [Pyrinomonadaceae bacterium]
MEIPSYILPGFFFVGKVYRWQCMKNHACRRELVSRIPGIFFICLASATFGFAQTNNPAGPLKLGEAVDLALANYPAIKTAQAQATVAEANIELSRTVYLPRLDFLDQENRVTRNNFFGVILPQSIVPSISGPVLSDTSLESAFGSAGGTLLSWEPFDFGARKAQVNVARVGAKQSHANVVATELDVAASAADAFMALAASQAGVRAAEANFARAQVFADSVHVLVNNQLRAGAEAARADADLSLARTQLLRAQQTTEISRAALAQALGVPGTALTIDSSALLEQPTDTTTPTPQFSRHPLAIAQELSIDVVRAREKVLARSYVPKFYLQGSFSGRGTGALTDGRFAGGLHGLWPTITNYGVGLTVTFPTFDIFSIRARRHIEAGNEAVEKSRYDLTIQALQGQYSQAQALVNGAVRIAQETPTELKSAQQAETLVLERYKYGLATVTDVADAQRLLAQAEIDDAVAHLNVWRALLIAAKLQGDLKPVLQRIRH